MWQGGPHSLGKVDMGRLQRALAARLRKRLARAQRRRGFSPRDIPGLQVWMSAERELAKRGQLQPGEIRALKRTRSRPLVRLITWLER